MTIARWSSASGAKNSVGNTENAGCRIFPFPPVFSRSTLLKTSLNSGLHLSSANALNFDETKILPLGRVKSVRPLA